MATFPSITPTYGLQKRSSPSTRTVRFGDGFELRLKYGLNQNPKVYQLTFEVSETDADTIEPSLMPELTIQHRLISPRQVRAAHLSSFVRAGASRFHT